jgi:hypothetical protein
MLNNWIEYATVTIILPWQLCYPNNFVTLTIILPWQLCYPNNFVTLPTLLPWQLCYPNNFVTLIYPDNFVTLTTLLPWQLCYTNNFVTLTILFSWQLCYRDNYATLATLLRRQLCLVIWHQRPLLTNCCSFWTTVSCLVHTMSVAFSKHEILNYIRSWGLAVYVTPPLPPPH